MPPVAAVIRFLRAPRTALATLSFVAVYSFAFAWSDLVEHPFTSPLFLAAVALLFLSTAVCTFDRMLAAYRLWNGQVTRGTSFPPRSDANFGDFLAANGFRRSNDDRWFHFRHALWAGPVLHIGILVVIAGVVVQQGFHDSGAFELTERESARLSAPGVVFARQSGLFAPALAPALDVALVSFDPYLHQRGYAPDRGSRLLIAGTERFVDRARGTEENGVTFFQAIPSGIAVNLEIADLGLRSIHLRRTDAHHASREVVDPAGHPVRIVVTSKRPLDDPAGTGALSLAISDAACDLRGGSPAGRSIDPDVSFRFGDRIARVAGFAWWGGFTYARNPGMPLVFFGFVVTLAGCAMLVFPAAVAGENWVYAKRGVDVLLADWQTFVSPSAKVNPVLATLSPMTTTL